MTTQYRVRLEAFEGPLDLLLHLIHRAEVDVQDIPVARITEQFLDSLGQIDRIDIELAGEFLLMAATLMEIKSRMLMPVPATGERAAGSEGEAGDPRADLVRQLLDYKKYRDAGEALENRLRVWEQRYPAGHAGHGQDESVGSSVDDLELDDLELVDLVEAFEQIISAVDLDRLGDHEIIDDDTPIELHAEDLMDRLRREGKVSGIELHRVFEGRTKVEMIGLFLAMLELVRQRRVGVSQNEHGIMVTLTEPDGVVENVDVERE